MEALVDRELATLGRWRVWRYRVRWAGWSEEHDSWEAASRIDPALVASYDAHFPRPAVELTFEVGTRVSARWLGGYRWYAARVTAVSADGTTCDVAYDDGDVEKGVRAIHSRVKPLAFSEEDSLG